MKVIKVKKKASLTEEAKDVQLPAVTASSIQNLFNRPEFKKPISDEEVESYLDETEDKTLESIQSIDRASVTECLKNYLTTAHPMVKDFKIQKCLKENKQLVIEGKITFNNGKIKNTTFTFKPSGKHMFKGSNSGIAEDAGYALKYRLDDNLRLLAEEFNYFYNVSSESLVEGLIKPNKK
jgi:hypothetical protein